MVRPDCIGNVLSAPRETCRIGAAGEAASESADLTSPGGISQFVVRHELLPAGRRASSAHSHSSREEFVFALQGALKIWIDGASYPLVPGDYVALPAGKNAVHYLYNDSDQDAAYLLIATTPQDDAVTYRLNVGRTTEERDDKPK